MKTLSAFRGAIFADFLSYQSILNHHICCWYD